MYDFFDSLTNVIVDRSADELIAAVMVALGLSLAFAGLDFLARRKAHEGRMLMIGLMIGANLCSMAIAAGYLVHLRRSRGALASDRSQAQSVRPYLDLVDSTFREADENRDGLLSSEEAAVAAAEFVRRVDPTGKGMINALSLEQALPHAGFHRGRRPIGGPMPYPPRAGFGHRRSPGPWRDEFVQPAGSPPRANSEETAESPREAPRPSDL